MNIIDAIIILIIFNLTIFSLKYFSYDINIIKQTAVVKNESKNDIQNKKTTKKTYTTKKIEKTPEWMDTNIEKDENKKVEEELEQMINSI